jgi:hypothetical protein
MVSTYHNTIMVPCETDLAFAQPSFITQACLIDTPYPRVVPARANHLSVQTHRSTPQTQVMGFQERLLFNIFLRKGISRSLPFVDPILPLLARPNLASSSERKRGNLNTISLICHIVAYPATARFATFFLPPPPPPLRLRRDSSFGASCSSRGRRTCR